MPYQQLPDGNPPLPPSASSAVPVPLDSTVSAWVLTSSHDGTKSSEETRSPLTCLLQSLEGKCFSEGCEWWSDLIELVVKASSQSEEVCWLAIRLQPIIDQLKTVRVTAKSGQTSQTMNKYAKIMENSDLMVFTVAQNLFWTLFNIYVTLKNCIALDPKYQTKCHQQQN